MQKVNTTKLTYKINTIKYNNTLLYSAIIYESVNKIDRIDCENLKHLKKYIKYLYNI